MEKKHHACFFKILFIGVIVNHTIKPDTMSSLRLRVQFGEEVTNSNSRKPEPILKFIHVVEFPSTETIAKLIETLQKYINQQYSTNNIQIIQLTTNDNFVLSKSNICATVLKDNDYIMCVDMKRFARENYQTIEYGQVWLEMKQHDASDNEEKFLRIGLSSFSKLFLRLRGNSNHFGVYMFTAYELMTIANEKPKDNLIVRLDNSNDNNQTSSTDWFIECKWEYDTVSNKSLFIICNLKIGASDNVISDKLGIVFDHSRMRIEKGEITHLSTDINDGSTLTDQQRQHLKELAAKLPSPKRTGPQINTTSTQNLKITKHECEGESSIRMASGNTNTVKINQETYTSGDKTFPQYFDLSHIIFSKKSVVLPEILNQKRSQPVEKPISVASIAVLYQTYDGAWRECHDIAIAPIPMRNEEPKWLTDSIINIQPDKLISFCIRGWIQVKGEPGSDNQTRGRSHKSLPQPLKLKIVATDSMGKQCTLVVEQLNKPIELPTQETYSNENQSTIKELLAFVYADDVERDERIYTVMYINKENALTIKNPGSYYVTFNRKILRTKEFHAKQNKTTEMIIEEMTYDDYDNTTKAIALYDPESYILYAIRLEASTKTSKSEETIFIPLEKIK